VAKNNQRDPNLRAATVARVNQLVKGGLTKAGAFEKISTETGRAKDAVQMLYYRAIRAAKAGSKTTVKAAKPKAAAASRPGSRRSSRKPARKSDSSAQGIALPALLNGIASVRARPTTRGMNLTSRMSPPEHPRNDPIVSRKSTEPLGATCRG
jgi:hypothetical protein